MNSRSAIVGIKKNVGGVKESTSSLFCFDIKTTPGSIDVPRHALGLNIIKRFERAAMETLN